MASRDTNDLHVILSAAYYKAIDTYKHLYPNEPQPFVTCTFRDNDEQNELYKLGPKFTRAKAGQSPHNYRPSLAFDIAFITLNKKLDWNIKLFKKFADILNKIEPRIEWGGSWIEFKDGPHFELNGWKNYIKK